MSLLGSIALKDQVEAFLYPHLHCGEKMVAELSTLDTKNLC